MSKCLEDDIQSNNYSVIFSLYPIIPYWTFNWKRKERASMPFSMCCCLKFLLNFSFSAGNRDGLDFSEVANSEKVEFRIEILLILKKYSSEMVFNFLFKEIRFASQDIALTWNKNESSFKYSSKNHMHNERNRSASKALYLLNCDAFCTFMI